MFFTVPARQTPYFELDIRAGASEAIIRPVGTDYRRRKLTTAPRFSVYDEPGQNCAFNDN